MKPEDFISFDGGMPIKNKWVIVTNNVNAKNAHGEMSHVWLTSIVLASMSDGIVMFDDYNRKIIGLTHYKYA